MMNVIVVTPDADKRSNKFENVYILKGIDTETKPIILVYDKENNILYEYI
jgi:hypothetical protein